METKSSRLALFKQIQRKAAIDATETGEKVVFMGDSITEFWSNVHPILSEKSYINRGIGQTSPQMLLRFRADVIDLKPAAVVILAGGNDIAGNTGPSTLEMIKTIFFRW
jgi:lysophospholipase L1-like esterase